MSVAVFARRNAGALAVGLAGCALLAWYLGRTHGEAHDDRGRALAEARTRLAACLAGEPIERGGAVHALRRATLAMAGGRDVDYPDRCATLAETLEARKKPRATERPAAALLRKGALSSVASPEVVALLEPDGIEPRVDFEALARGIPRPQRTREVPSALPVLHPAPIEAIAGDRELVLRLGREVVCRLAAAADGVEPVARCSFHADSLAARTLAWSADATALAVPTATGVRAWSTGEPLLESAEVALASVTRAATFAWLPAARPRAYAVRTGEVTRTIPLPEPGPTAESVTLIADQLLWIDGGRLHARTLGPTSASAVATLGTASGRPQRQCASATTIAVELGPTARQLALHHGGRWSLVDLRDAPSARELYCGDGRVTLVGVGGDAVTLVRADCTHDGCVLQRGKVPARAAFLGVAPIGDDVVVVWASELVWAVRGPLASLASAPRRPIFDAMADEHDQVTPVPRVNGLRVVTRGASTLVLFDIGGTRALHLRDDQVEPVRVVWE